MFNDSSSPSKSSSQKCSRRDVLKAGQALGAGTVLAAMAVPRVHAAEDNTIRLALIGSGGRGSGAVANAISAGRSARIGWPRETRRHGRRSREPPDGLLQQPDQGIRAAISMSRPSDASSASTPIAKQSTACGPAMWPC